MCAIDGCLNEAMAKGLCSKHYQRQRREGPTSGQVGRPRKYPKEVTEKYQGAPTMSVRFAPEIMDWVKSKGGATWLRYVVSELRKLAAEPEFKDWNERLQLSDQEGEE